MNSQTKSSTTFGKYKTTISIGSTVEKEGDTWSIPSDDTNTPEPIKIEIISIASVCDNDGYWTGLPTSNTHVLSPASEPLKSKCANLKHALKTYSDYLKLVIKPGKISLHKLKYKITFQMIMI